MAYFGKIVAALSAAVALACSASVGTQPRSDGGTSSVAFDQSGVLTLAPTDVVALDLSATNAQSVTLSLVGNYLDAFLDVDTVDVSTGRGAVMLHAPSSASTFSVIASAGASTARLDVAVSATGFASVRVTVNYQGKRAVPIVFASTFVETTCAQIGTSANDGSPLTQGTDGEKLVISSVPTDGQVAVAVRIAHYATGCFDVSSLTPGETRDVTVPVFDLPLDLADTTLETRFSFAPDSDDAAALAEYFTGVASTVIDASFPSSNEAGSLLDAMATASSSPSLFATARSQKYWDSTMGTWLAQHTPSMHTRVATWLGEAALGNVSDLTGHIDGAPANPIFTPLMLGTLDAKSAGISAPNAFLWSGQANDILSLTGAIKVVSSALSCAAADARAVIDAPPATGVVSALATEIDCTGIGTALANGGNAFGQCDATCVTDLCASALTAKWTAGAESLAAPNEALTLAITVAAPVQLTDTPEVESFSGSFVGSFATNNSSVPTEGSAKAAHGVIPN